MSDISEATSLSAPSLSAPSTDSLSPQIPVEQSAYNNTQQTMEIICSDLQFLSWQYHDMITDIKDKKQKKFITLQYIQHSERNYRKCTKLLSIHSSVTSMLMGVL